MKTIITVLIGVIFLSDLSGQCNKIPDPDIPKGYVKISSMKINMDVSKNELNHKPLFLLKDNYSYKFQIINANGFSTNAQIKLYEDNVLIGTNYNKEHNEIYSDFFRTLFALLIFLAMSKVWFLISHIILNVVTKYFFSGSSGHLMLNQVTNIINIIEP